MLSRFRRKTLRVVCTLVALCSAFVCSGCDDVLSYLDGYLSSSVEAVDGDTSVESSSTHSSVEDGDTNVPDESSATYSADGDVTSGEDDSNPPETTPADLEKEYGYQYLACYEDGEQLQGFYRDLYDLCTAFYDGKQDIQGEKVEYNNGTTATEYRIGQADYGKYALSYEQARTVWNLLLVECPEFYWIAHSASATTTHLSLCIDGEYALYATRQAIDEKLQTVVTACASYLDEEMSQTERALTIEEYVIANMTYAYKADNVTPEDTTWAHNIEGITKKTGVCESYAKTYDYLCTRLGVNCITVTGVAGENESDMGGHAWNAVQIDNVWYAMDLTWEDGNFQPNRRWIGTAGSEFAETHIANTPQNGFGSTWLYALPTLAETPLQAVAVQQEGEEKRVFYPNLDLAFATMTEETASYVVELCPQTSAGDGEEFSVYPYEVTFTASVLPKTAKTTLRGKYVKNTIYSTVTAKNALSVSSPVWIESGRFTYPWNSTGTTNISEGKNGVAQRVIA